MRNDDWSQSKVGRFLGIRQVGEPTLLRALIAMAGDWGFVGERCTFELTQPILGGLAQVTICG